MVLGLVTIVLVDAILFLMVRLVHAQWARENEGVPLTYAGGLFVLCCVAHFAATKTLGRCVTNPREAWLVVVVSAGSGRVPIWAYVHMLFTRLHADVDGHAPDPYPRARERRDEGDIEGALHEYFKYFEADPSSPGPLFSAANMLELEKEYKIAASVFGKILDRFRANDDAWAKAAYRQAFLLEHHLDDEEEAMALRGEIAFRIPAGIRAKYASRDVRDSGF